MTSVSGTVIHGKKYQHKAPTANLQLEHPMEPGNFTAMCQVDGEVIGQGMIWSQPDSNVLEVYVGGFEGNLYEKDMELLDIHRLEPDLLCALLDQALSSIPLNGEGASSSAPTPEPVLKEGHMARCATDRSTYLMSQEDLND